MGLAISILMLGAGVALLDFAFTPIPDGQSLTGKPGDLIRVLQRRAAAVAARGAGGEQGNAGASGASATTSGGGTQSA